MIKIHPNTVFINGAISPAWIANAIQSHHTQKHTGGHSIFLGQVRMDIIDNKPVEAIEYTTYTEMAIDALQLMCTELEKKYALDAIQVNHSLGIVNAGEICLFVFTSAKHRRAAVDACTELVELIKAELPVWGREIFSDQTHSWKENKN